MLNTKIDITNLYSIFFGKKLLSLSKYEPKTPPKVKSATEVLTPLSLSIYESVSPASKPYILMDMLSDNNLIDTIENKMFDLDPDYQEKMENNGLGFFMEEYISVYGFCPVCNQPTLKKYAQPNIPVVDLVCVNSDYHLQKNECFLYQVKISLSNTYFNLNQQKISVGSKKYGEFAHLHKGSENLDKKIVVPGYICIKLINYPSESQTYVVDHRNSFVLIPDYNNNSNKYYYQYADEKNIFGKNIIKWNSSMINIVPIKQVVQTTKIGHEFFSEFVIKNPYQKLLGEIL
jgi:hypothetical protein